MIWYNWKENVLHAEGNIFSLFLCPRWMVWTGWSATEAWINLRVGSNSLQAGRHSSHKSTGSDSTLTVSMLLIYLAIKGKKRHNWVVTWSCLWPTAEWHNGANESDQRKANKSSQPPTGGENKISTSSPPNPWGQPNSSSLEDFSSQ